MTLKRALVIAALVVALVVLGGCGSIVGGMLDTTNGLRHAGFGAVSVKPVPVQGAAGNVDVSVSVKASPSDAAARSVARIVWNDLHEHFDVLNLTVHGTGPALHHSYAFAALVTLFGPRNPAYDRSSVTSSTESLGIDVLIGFVVVLVVAAAVVIIVVVLRRRRGPPPPWGGFHQQGGPGSLAPGPSWGASPSPSAGWSNPGWGGSGGSGGHGDQPPPAPPGGGWGDPAPGS